MARPAKWNSPTESIRLPKHAIEACLNLAKALDQEIPETQDDTEFQEYASFVQNASQPRLFTITDGKGSRDYLMQVDPITFDEYQTVKRAADELMQRLDAEKLSRDDRVWLLSELISESFPQVKRA